jgi:amino acid adenylation domain-containing protein
MSYSGREREQVAEGRIAAIARGVLTPMQEAMYRRAQVSDDAGIDVELICVEFPDGENVDVAALAESLAEWTTEFESLRTGFADGPMGPEQVVFSAAAVGLEVEDLRSLSVADRSLELERRQEAERRRGFELSCPPLIRVRLFRLADDRWTAMFVVHHLVYDCRSGVELFSWLLRAYDARVARTPAPGPARSPRPSMIDFARAIRSQPTEGRREFWTRLLDGVDLRDEHGIPRPSARGVAAQPARPHLGATPAPAAGASAARSDHREPHPTSDQPIPRPVGYVVRPVPADLLREIEGFAKLADATVNSVLQAAWSVLLARYSGCEDVTWGSTRVGRGGTIDGSEGLVGMCINAVVSRIGARGTSTLAELARELRGQHLAVRAHQHTPSAQVHEWIGAPPTRLFQTLFTYDAFSLEHELGRHCSRAGQAPRRFRVLCRPGLPVTMMFAGGPAPSLEVVYERSEVSDSAAEHVADHFLTFLAEGCRRPGASVNEIAHVPAGRREWIVGRSRGRSFPYPSDLPVHRLFERRAAAHPDDVAIVSGETRLTYRELNAAADRLAALLAAKGVGSETPVAIVSRRSPEFLIAVLAALKAGGAYVPLESDNPLVRQQRALAAMPDAILITDAGAPRGTDDGVARLVAPERVLRFPAGAPENLSVPPAPAPPFAAPGALANIIFTSGSTGQPKGVMVTHRAIVRLVHNGFLPFSRGDTYLLLSSPAFDVSTLEIWGPLLTGGTVVVHPHGPIDLGELRRNLAANRVTRLWLTASLFNMIVDTDPGILEGVDTILAGGEALSPSHVRRAQAALPAAQIINGYGPTENTTFSSTHALPGPLHPSEASVPIGIPLDHSSQYVLDVHRQLCDADFVGELSMGGDGLALGYLRDEALTRERFVPSIADLPHESLLYRSGDLARLRGDGTFDYVGRRDAMVKIRGFRVDLGEVETALASCDGVLRAAAVFEPRGNHRALVAYLVCDDDFAHATLRRELKYLLPDYMIPRELLRVNALPLTGSGKLDRNALSKARGEPIDVSAAPSRAVPQTELEARVGRAIGEVLGIESPDPDAGFFDLGGHSLAAVALMLRLERDFGLRWGTHQLVRNPSIRHLTAEIEAQLASQHPETNGAAQNAQAHARGSGGPQSTSHARGRDLGVVLRPGGAAAPVFLAPGVEGSVLQLRALPDLLPGDRPIIAVRPHGTQPGEHARRTLAACADDLIATVDRHWPAGPVHLVGYSFGGAVVYEAARRLQAAGREVGMVVLIDMVTGHLLLGQSSRAERLRWALMQPSSLPALVVRRVRWARSNGQPTPPTAASEKSLPIVEAHMEALRHYEWPTYDGRAPINLLVARETSLGRPRDLGWRRLGNGKLRIHDMSGNHVACLSPPHVSRLASTIAKCLERCESERSPR